VLPSSGHIPHAGRQRISESIPTHEQLMAIKHKKKVSQDSYNFKCIVLFSLNFQVLYRILMYVYPSTCIFHLLTCVMDLSEI
jgi:hypothetical protein